MTFKAGEDIDVTDYVIQVEAGETLATRDAVYIDTSDGKAYKCDADSLDEIGLAGFVVEGVSATATVNILTWGIMGGFSGLTANTLYYLSGTAGEITATKPSNFKIAAKALSATVIKIWDQPTERVRVYTSSDTWNKPAGLIKVEVEVQAAGGNGSAGTAGQVTGAGGGGGGYSYKLIYATDLGSTETVTVGTTAGSSSSFGTHATATGGSNASGRTPGAGGAGSSGTLNIPGAQGTGGQDGIEGSGGPGGSSRLGIAGGGSYFSTDGEAGNGYGSGGGGGGGTSGSGFGAGGAFAPGVVIVREWY